MWRIVGVSFDFIIGGSFYAWLHQHALGHHLYTNVRGADPDLGMVHSHNQEKEGRSGKDNKKKENR